jgi:hypothetical protein
VNCCIKPNDFVKCKRQRGGKLIEDEFVVVYIGEYFNHKSSSRKKEYLLVRSLWWKDAEKARSGDASEKRHSKGFDFGQLRLLLPMHVLEAPRSRTAAEMDVVRRFDSTSRRQMMLDCLKKTLGTKYPQEAHCFRSLTIPTRRSDRPKKQPSRLIDTTSSAVM